MRAALTREDVEALEGHRSPAEHRVLAERLLAWAAGVHPQDEPSTAELLDEQELAQLTSVRSRVRLTLGMPPD